MENDIKSAKIIDATETCKLHVLNLDKVENLEDCKKILKFLCGLAIKPLPEGVEYDGFSEVEKYFY